MMNTKILRKELQMLKSIKRAKPARRVGLLILSCTISQQKVFIPQLSPIHNNLKYQIRRGKSTIYLIRCMVIHNLPKMRL
jgi:hypothetical protein